MKKIIIGIVILALLGGGAYLVLGNDDKEDSSSDTSGATSSSEKADDSSSVSTNTTAPSATSEVSIEDMAFTQASITVKKGTTVTWTNKDSVQHSVAPDSETSEFKEGDLLSKGQSYKVTFNTPGTYSYHCTPHPSMKGSVTVTE